MPDRFRSLVVSGDDELRQELVERAIWLNFSVHVIGRPEELPPLLGMHDFDWLILDVGLGEDACRLIIHGMATARIVPRTILVGGKDPAALASVHDSAAQADLEVVGMPVRPLSVPAFTDLPAPGSGEIDLGLASRGLDAIPGDELVVHYQPIASMADRTIRRVEALVRWQHPHLGLIRPRRFIAHAVRSGAIVPLTWEVLRRTVGQHVVWKGEGNPLFVSVNISALFLESPQAVDAIFTLLESRNCDPRYLVLEITEGEAARNPPLARAMLARLRDAGVKISMDDYGVGYSNLERLRYYPFSELKIDRGFVACLETSGEARCTVEMLASLARREKFSLTGEGIETQKQWDILEELGCDFGQGFLIAHPMPADQVGKWIGGKSRAGQYRRPLPI